MDKETALYPHGAPVLLCTKEWNTDLHYIPGDSWKRAKWPKAVSEDHVLYILRIQNLYKIYGIDELWRQKSGYLEQEDWAGNEQGLLTGTGFLGGTMKMS